MKRLTCNWVRTAVATLLLILPVATSVATPEASSTNCADPSLGCVIRIREVVEKPEEFLNSYLRMTGLLTRKHGNWLLVDEGDSSVAIAIDMPDHLGRRMFEPNPKRANATEVENSLIRVSGAKIDVAAGASGGLEISDFSFVQRLRTTDEIDQSESVDGLGSTRCSKVYELRGDYCEVGVSTIAIHRERYDGEKVSVLGYLRCASSIDHGNLLYASLDAANTETSSEALVLGDNWEKKNQLIEALCRSVGDGPHRARIIGQFSAGSDVSQRRDSLGLVHQIEFARRVVGFPHVTTKGQQ